MYELYCFTLYYKKLYTNQVTFLNKINTFTSLVHVFTHQLGVFSHCFASCCFVVLHLSSFSTFLHIFFTLNTVAALRLCFEVENVIMVSHWHCSHLHVSLTLFFISPSFSPQWFICLSLTRPRFLLEHLGHFSRDGKLQQ